MSETRLDLTPEEALALLPPGEDVHTFRQAGYALIGADWPRDTLVQAIRDSDVRTLTGPGARAMEHGLAINEGGAVLFIETVESAVVALESKVEADVVDELP